MAAIDVESARIWLQRRRRQILEASRRAAAEIEQLRGAPRVQELEEGSQSEQAQHGLSSLGEVAQEEIALIDAALQRLDAGEYGVCRSCGEEIDARRLAAVPFGVDCAECAGEREKVRKVERARGSAPRSQTLQ